jgi:hypothetical protein
MLATVVSCQDSDDRSLRKPYESIGKVVIHDPKHYIFMKKAVIHGQGAQDTI